MQNPQHLSEWQTDELHGIFRFYARPRSSRVSMQQSLDDFCSAIEAGLSLPLTGRHAHSMPMFVWEGQLRDHPPRQRSDLRDSMFREIMWVLRNRFFPIPGQDIEKRRLPEGNIRDRPSDPSECWYYTWVHLNKHYYIYPTGWATASGPDCMWTLVTMRMLAPDYDTDDTAEHVPSSDED